MPFFLHLLPSNHHERASLFLPPPFSPIFPPIAFQYTFIVYIKQYYRYLSEKQWNYGQKPQKNLRKPQKIRVNFHPGYRECQNSHLLSQNNRDLIKNVFCSLSGGWERCFQRSDRYRAPPNSPAARAHDQEKPGFPSVLQPVTQNFPDENH